MKNEGLILEIINNLKEELHDLKEDMKEGFKTVHEKQDKTNGKVMANTKWRYIVMGALALTNAILIPLGFLLLSKAF